MPATVLRLLSAVAPETSDAELLSGSVRSEMRRHSPSWFVDTDRLSGVSVADSSGRRRPTTPFRPRS